MGARQKKSIRTSVILPEQAHTRIGALAAANDVSTAWVIRHALIRFLDEVGEETDLPLRQPSAKKASA